jgi:hypothetical protein
MVFLTYGNHEKPDPQAFGSVETEVNKKIFQTENRKPSLKERRNR